MVRLPGGTRPRGAVANATRSERTDVEAASAIADHSHRRLQDLDTRNLERFRQERQQADFDEDVVRFKEGKPREGRVIGDFDVTQINRGTPS
jgi:hypothetical protein